jgi:gliding motility-associated-like protein
MRKALDKIAALIILAVVLRPGFAVAQTGPNDTISYSSACANTTILFSSPIFDSLTFPKYVRWHFGDPGSGFNDSTGAQQGRHAYASPGTYNVRLAILNGGSTDTIYLTKTMVISNPVAFTFGPDIYLCQGNDTTVLRGPVIPGAAYTWNDDSTGHADTLLVTRSGVYTVSINGCGVPDSVGVYVSDTPRLNLGKDHRMCDSSNLVLNAASMNGQYTWLLDGNPLPFNGDQLQTHYPGGTYTAIVTVPGCGVYRDSARITYASPLASGLSLGPDTLLCPKQVFTLNATTAGATAYDWSTGATTPQINVTNPADYWVFVTVNGCQITDSVLVTYRGDRPLDFHDTAICQGSTLTLNADFGTGTYNWQSIPPQRDDQNQTGQSTYYVYKAGKYSITATVGQCIYTDTLTVSFDDSLKVRLNTTDTTLCKGEDFRLLVAGNADTYAWQDSSREESFQVAESGAYRVVAQNGCGKDTLSAVVNLTACACQLSMPTAFTPNGDGHNDVFRPLHACDMAQFQLAVYDRFGDLVFRSENPMVGWDGTYKGRQVTPDTFVWMVRYFSIDTKQSIFKKGTVLVMR